MVYEPAEELNVEQVVGWCCFEEQHSLRTLLEVLGWQLYETGVATGAGLRDMVKEPRPTW